MTDRTEDKMLGEVAIPWGEAWTVTCRLARIGNRIELVGIAIESDPYQPVNSEVWRSIRLGDLKAAALIQLARDGVDLIGPPTPSPSREPGHLTRTAAFWYTQAIAAGSRTPSKTAAESLRADGWDVTNNAVRGAIHRARKAGLIPDAQ